ncbi:MAG: hypothetical protein AAGD10_10365 [Myxococcota bacterium]
MKRCVPAILILFVTSCGNDIETTCERGVLCATELDTGGTITEAACTAVLEENEELGGAEESFNQALFACDDDASTCTEFRDCACREIEAFDVDDVFGVCD